MTFKVQPVPQEDHTLFFSLAAQTFEPDADPDKSASSWQAFFSTLPGFGPEQILGVYEGDSLLSGCIVYENQLRCGIGTILTGCVGAVFTHPDHRLRGAGQALMDGVTAFGLDRKHALQFLDGIGGFYHRWGYVKALELTHGAIELDAIRQLEAADYQVRPATPDDAPQLLALYNRHLATYTGSFKWSVEQMRHRIAHRGTYEFCLLAVDERGDAQGYLFLNHLHRQRATEVVANDQTATFTLLKEHALRYSKQKDIKETLIWPFAPHASLLYHVSDTLPVRCETYYTPNAFWMARIAHLPSLIQALVPVWQHRWQRSTASWSGDIQLVIGGEAYLLRMIPGNLQVHEKVAETSHTVRITPGAFVQLIFGYRPIAWYVAQSEQCIPEHLIPVLDILFPRDHAFVPGTDHF